MCSFWDFLGFGSKRRIALENFDRALAQLQVNPAYVDDGMRYAMYAWLQNLPPQQIDQGLRDAAALISLCVLGPTETAAVWGKDVSDQRQARLAAAIDHGNDETFDAKVIKLVLMKGIAAAEVAARVSLE